MNGLVIEGGGRRGIFAAGVLDCFAQNSLSFEYIAGVSSGAQAALDFAAGQIGRTKAVIMPGKGEKSKHRIKNRLKMDIEQIIYEYPYSKIPFDFDNFFASKAIVEIVATDCQTGEAEYFRETSDEQLLLKKLCASCSLPIIYPTVEIDGRHYMDGSISDSIPVQRALDCGCERVVAVLAKPVEEPATDYGKFKFAVDKIYRGEYPVLADRLLDRLDRYNHQCRQLEELEKQGRLYIIRPTETLVGAFEKNEEKINNAYSIGLSAALEQMSEIKKFLS